MNKRHGQYDKDLDRSAAAANRFSRRLTAPAVFLLSALLLLSLALTGCGGGDSDQPVTIDMDKLALELQEGIAFKDTMSEVDSAVFYMLYGLTEEDVDREVMISSTGATAEEITIIHAASADKLEGIRSAVDAHIQAQRDGFENYVPEELDKLAEPVIKEIGDYIIVCVSDDNSGAENIIAQYGK
ncbi:DUF4358 domain-containing protein [Bacilliculturomica massiliensis]|uniref:DUF4358 domain-containing protein n=1 Tax=Bacilliculturomica massiliensis TaxID=1917867 RepID=UPI0013EF5986|nr:DUF4358 domain-containing protein [Bacilliculturomica massiliensis]